MHPQYNKLLSKYKIFFCISGPERFAAVRRVSAIHIYIIIRKIWSFCIVNTFPSPYWRRIQGVGNTNKYPYGRGCTDLAVAQEVYIYPLPNTKGFLSENKSPPHRRGIQGVGNTINISRAGAVRALMQRDLVIYPLYLTQKASFRETQVPLTGGGFRGRVTRINIPTVGAVRTLPRRRSVIKLLTQKASRKEAFCVRSPAAS